MGFDYCLIKVTCTLFQSDVISTLFRVVYILKTIIPQESSGLTECLHVFLEVMKNTKQIRSEQNYCCNIERSL